MSCNKSCQPEQTICPSHDNNYSYIIIIVLYILLAIILGACLFN